MFREIFLFEIRSRVRRPTIYLFFAAVLVMSLLTFATGSLPVGENEHINSPYLICFWCAGMTMLMMLVSSIVMGTALYRDIECQTKDYYLTYPITKAGYFWGRFCGSFFFMILIALAIPLGIWLGTQFGVPAGKALSAQYGPNRPLYYLYAFGVVALPNIFFTSALFYGLVSVMRNVKVIYFGGVFLSLMYFMTLFFLNHTNNQTVIDMADPFGLNGLRARMFASNYIQLNSSLPPFNGALGLNRIIWPGFSMLVLIVTYLRFNFEDFFAGRRDKAAADEMSVRSNRTLRKPALNFSGAYNRRTLGGLVRIELLNIIRDNYFWVIVGCGSFFLGFIFWLGDMRNGVPEWPRTVMLLSFFSDGFPFFIFFIIMFYAGETLQRDRLTRYALINDSLPPPNWVLNGSKLISILILSIGLAFLPAAIGVPVQWLKGYSHFHLPTYLEYVFILLLPKFLTGAVLCYFIQIILNNKFIAYAVIVPLWVGMFFLDATNTFNYHLLLYSFTPATNLSDMDGMGQMVRPISWFDFYWTLAAAILLVLAALLYNRGVNSSLKERLQLIPERFDRTTRIWSIALFLLFLSVGVFIYYNISYTNEWLTHGEEIDRAANYEKTLKKYQQLPLPKMTRLVESIDLYPEKAQELVHATVTVANKADKPIREMLLDGDELADYSISIGGKPMEFTCPLMYRRGMFSWFRPVLDSAPYRLYRFPTPLAPGDSLVLELRSRVAHKGFGNGNIARQMAKNGTVTGYGLPELGYDDDDELSSRYERLKAGLPPKNDEDIPQTDPVGRNTLRAGAASDLLQVDLTVSVPGDQTAVTQGRLLRRWKEGDRNHFHYTMDRPGTYMPLALSSARYADRRDSVMLDHPVAIDIFYHPEHGGNLDRFLQAYKDGLRYYSRAYGSYPWDQIRLAETSTYGPAEMSSTMMDAFSEYNSWNAHFESPDENDYLYFQTTRLLAQQWWRFQVAPNNTVGSMVIPEGLATYDALMMAEKKYGVSEMRRELADQLFFYTVIHRRITDLEHPILTANLFMEWGGKAGVVLYGLRQLIGEDNLTAALREFRDSFAFRRHGPFAGTNDLYGILRRHVPDSLQYYLTDTWQKVTAYDNKVEEAEVNPTGIAGEYRVHMTVNIDKLWKDSTGNDVPAVGMDDYIDIGVFGEPRKDSTGRTVINLLYDKRYRFTRGAHALTFVVEGKPTSVAVDPVGYLVDRNGGDNVKAVK